MIKSQYSKAIEENKTTDTEYEVLLEELKEYIKSFLNVIRDMNSASRNEFIKDKISEFVATKHPIIKSMVDSNGVMNNKMLELRLYEDSNEYGCITAYLNNPQGYTDISCDGVGPGRMFLKKGIKTYPLVDANGNDLYFSSIEEIEAVINKLAYFDGLRLTSRNPILRANTLQDYRLTATDKSMSTPVFLPDGKRAKMPTFEIRLSKKEDTTFQNLIYVFKSFPPEIAKALIVLSKLESHCMAYVGTPGVGKTTLMLELLRMRKDAMVVKVASTDEGDLTEYDANGTSISRFRSYTPTAKEDGSNDESRGTLMNILYATLSMKLDVLCIIEIRTTEELNAALEAVTMGKTLHTTLHGPNEEIAVERFIKKVQEAKKCSRSEAIQEVSLSLHTLVILKAYSDNIIRPAYITEVVRNINERGEVYLTYNRIYEFKLDNDVLEIDEETGLVKGQFQKVGVPKSYLKMAVQESNITQSERDTLMKPASHENPIVYSREWWNDAKIQF